MAEALDNALDAGGTLLAAWEVADALPRAVAMPTDPEDRERVALAARSPQWVDVATVSALADVLAATRRLERVFVGQRAYNTYQEARGWAMLGEPAEVDRTLGRAEELAERTVARQADVPTCRPTCTGTAPGSSPCNGPSRGTRWETPGSPSGQPGS